MSTVTQIRLQLLTNDSLVTAAPGGVGHRWQISKVTLGRLAGAISSPSALLPLADSSGLPCEALFADTLAAEAQRVVFVLAVFRPLVVRKFRGCSRADHCTLTHSNTAAQAYKRHETRVCARGA